MIIIVLVGHLLSPLPQYEAVSPEKLISEGIHHKPCPLCEDMVIVEGHLFIHFACKPMSLLALIDGINCKLHPLYAHVVVFKGSFSDDIETNTSI